jgi:hypothetical protein
MGLELGTRYLELKIYLMGLGTQYSGLHIQSSIFGIGTQKVGLGIYFCTSCIEFGLLGLLP